MWSKVGMGGKHHRYYKHNKFRQNPKGDPKFLVDLTWNDPLVIQDTKAMPVNDLILSQKFNNATKISSQSVKNVSSW